MPAKNSGYSKSLKPLPKLAPRPRLDTKTHHKTTKSIVCNSNISTSARNSQNGPKIKSAPAPVTPEVTELSKSEIGTQVDEADIIANDCERAANGMADSHIVRLPSAKIISEIEKDRQQKSELHLKALLNETRQFEQYAAKQEIHLTNLKEYLDTGVITKKRADNCEDNCDADDIVVESYKATSDKTINALESYDRIKQKEEELIKLFNSV